MNKIEAIVKAQASNAVKSLNPEFYGRGSQSAALPSKPLISNPSAITSLSVSQSNDELKLNKTEAQYYRFLKLLRHQFVGVQCMTLKLGDDCRYTADFLVLNQEGKLEAHEVKGFMREDALVKLKVAARMYRFINFFLVKKTKTEWDIKPVKA